MVSNKNTLLVLSSCKMEWYIFLKKFLWISCTHAWLHNMIKHWNYYFQTFSTPFFCYNLSKNLKSNINTTFQKNKLKKDKNARFFSCTFSLEFISHFSCESNVWMIFGRGDPFTFLDLFHIVLTILWQKSTCNS
jgi:hypothetical protein